MTHIIIAGCHDFNDYAVVDKEVMSYIEKFIGKVEIKIISGRTSGVDALGERFATEHNLNTSTHLGRPVADLSKLFVFVKRTRA